MFTIAIHYLAAFVRLSGPAQFAFVAICCASYQGYLSLDPFFSIAASLKAMQCVKLRVKGRLS